MMNAGDGLPNGKWIPLEKIARESDTREVTHGKSFQAFSMQSSSSGFSGNVMDIKEFHCCLKFSCNLRESQYAICDGVDNCNAVDKI